MKRWVWLIFLTIFGSDALGKTIENTAVFENQFARGSDTAILIIGRELAQATITPSGGLVSTPDGTRVEFGSESVSTDTTLIILEPEPPPIVPDLAGGYRSGGVFREFILQDGSITTKVKLILPCPNRPDIERWRIYWWDGNEWIDQGGEVENGFISIFTDHFSTYGVMGSSLQPDLNKAYCYPNPFRPSKGHNKITWTFLPSDIRIRVFNIAGELVKDEEASTPGYYEWHDATNLASGIYIYLITSGKEKATGKIGIVK